MLERWNKMVNFNELSISQSEGFSLSLDERKTMNELQKRLDMSEKNQTQKFHDFSDSEMLMWYLNRQQHLDASHDRTKRTINEYQRELKLFISHLLEHGAAIGLDMEYLLEDSLFKSLQPRHLRRYQEWLATQSPYVLKKGKYSPATLERKTTILKSFFSFLHEHHYISEPIHKGFRISTVRKDERPNRDLGPSDVLALLDAYKEMNHPIMFAIVHFLVTSGVRNEEFCRLQVQDIKRDLINGGYYVRVLGKGNKRRDIPLKEKVLNSIRMFRYARGLAALEDANPTEPLFTTNSLKAYSVSYFTQYVKNQIQQLPAGIVIDKDVTITPHVFRHAFAIISSANRVDVYSIMRSLGHEKIETTMIYLAKVFEKNQHAIHQWKPELFGKYI